jgi:hypothetical protein
MSRSLTTVSVAMALAFALSTGCVVQNDPHPVSKVLPTAENAQIHLPQNNAQQLALGNLAETYMWTRQITREFNTSAAWVLIIVHAVVQFPPTDVQGNTAIWQGSDPLDPAEWRLSVTELADGTYDWELAGRSKITPEDGFLPLIVGHAVPGQQNRGTGEFYMDFDNMYKVDPIDNPDARGNVTVTYDLENRDGTQGTLDMHIETTVDENGAEVPVVADYHYAENQDRSGNFEFTFVGDIDENGSAYEQARIRSRWNVDGSGRSDVLATDGDLGDGSASFSQCWDTQFRSVYEDFEVPQGGAADGDPNDCAFSDLDLPDA